MPEVNTDYFNADELSTAELDLFANDLFDILDNAQE